MTRICVILYHLMGMGGGEEQVHLPLVRTQFVLTTLGSTGPRFWNSLEPRIAQSVSIYVVKRKLKLLYLSRYRLDL